MLALLSWLKRLAVLDPQNVGSNHLRVLCPGYRGLEIDDFIITADPKGTIPYSCGQSWPETLSLLQFLDRQTPAIPLVERERWIVELASAISLALERRIEILPDIAARVAGTDRIFFAPYGQAEERSMIGPVPAHSKSEIERTLQLINGLDDADAEVLGAAAGLHHGATLVFDRDIRSAYVLAIAGIEALSQRYGIAPTEWSAWEVSGEWDEFLDDLALSDEQAKGIRSRLMRDRHLRLKATFRTYAVGRLEDEFWSREVMQWGYGVDATTGSWATTVSANKWQMRDIIGADREQLYKRLGWSYDLRSGIVHSGDWIGLTELMKPEKAIVEMTVKPPLPFAALRAILAELIRVELAKRSRGGALPDVRLQRSTPAA